MDKALLFGLMSALLYGLTDFVAKFTNKANGVLPTMLWGQAALASCLTIAVLAGGQIPGVSVALWGITLVSCFAVVAGTGCLYYGLAKGRLTIVSPLMATYGAVSALLSVATGEKMTDATVMGLGLAIVGAVLAATSAKASASGKTSGWLPATGAALLYGIGFWLQGKYSLPTFGPLVTLWIYYVSATLIVALVCVMRRKSIVLHGVKNVGLVLGTALLAGSGYAALAIGQSAGEIAIPTALSSASTAITVMLAFAFLKEKPGIRGWLGICGVVSGVVILHLTSG